VVEILVVKCKICEEKREFNIQIGKNKDLVFCNICGQILARGLKLLEDAGQIKITFGEE
jgi:uncharacterized Zn finger protein